MNILVVGGSGSGKSAYAERLACRLSPRRTYIATMKGGGTEADARIQRHREQRRGLGFVTIECPKQLVPPQELGDATRGVVLLDDLGNLVANTLFAPDGTMADPACVLERLSSDVAALFSSCAHVVVVGNEVGCEGLSPYEGTRAWVRLQGSLCCALAAQADYVVEVVAGVPHFVKGGLQ